MNPLENYLEALHNITEARAALKAALSDMELSKLEYAVTSMRYGLATGEEFPAWKIALLMGLPYDSAPYITGILRKVARKLNETEEKNG